MTENTETDGEVSSGSSERAKRRRSQSRQGVAESLGITSLREAVLWGALVLLALLMLLVLQCHCHACRGRRGCGGGCSAGHCQRARRGAALHSMLLLLLLLCSVACEVLVVVVVLLLLHSVACAVLEVVVVVLLWGITRTLLLQRLQCFCATTRRTTTCCPLRTVVATAARTYTKRMDGALSTNRWNDALNSSPRWEHSPPFASLRQHTPLCAAALLLCHTASQTLCAAGRARSRCWHRCV